MSVHKADAESCHCGIARLSVCRKSRMSFYQRRDIDDVDRPLALGHIFSSCKIAAARICSGSALGRGGYAPCERLNVDGPHLEYEISSVSVLARYEIGLLNVSCRRKRYRSAVVGDRKSLIEHVTVGIYLAVGAACPRGRFELSLRGIVVNGVIERELVEYRVTNGTLPGVLVAVLRNLDVALFTFVTARLYCGDIKLFRGCFCRRFCRCLGGSLGRLFGGLFLAVVYVCGVSDLGLCCRYRPLVRVTADKLLYVGEAVAECEI